MKIRNSRQWVTVAATVGVFLLRRSGACHNRGDDFAVARAGIAGRSLVLIFDKYFTSSL
jgi:hypothetical protein